MFDYLQKFNKLPSELRSKISQKEVMSRVNELEKKYQVDLAALVMKVMVKQVPYNNLSLYLVGEKGLEEQKAQELSKKLKETVFKDVSDYLDNDKEKDINTDNKESNTDKQQATAKKEDPQELINEISKKQDHNTKIDTATKDIIAKADVSLTSGYLSDRLHMVLRTYLKGVRDKISTRSVLSRAGQEGGLNLDDASIDKVLKLADKYKKSEETKIEKPKPKVSEEAEKRDKLEALNENYSLKDSLKSKEEQENKKEDEKKEGEKIKKESKQDLNKEEKKADATKEEEKEIGKEEKDEKEGEKKEDLYKKLHIKRGIAPPSPSTVVNKEKESTDSHKEGTERHSENKEVKETDKEKQPEEIKESETKKEAKEKVEDSSIKEAKELEDENKKDLTPDQDNKGEQKPEQEDKEKQVDDKKKVPEVNSVNKKEAGSDLKNTPQESKSPSAGNLSQAPVSSGKKSMQDIKVNQRIMGPIDELRYFNLKNFRRLSSDPQEAFTKIKEKIELLTKESYEKRIEGIQAWKENPLNKLYHQISRESLDQSKPISEVIKQRKENDMDYLSGEELKALVSFNRSYMF